MKEISENELHVLISPTQKEEIIEKVENADTKSSVAWSKLSSAYVLKVENKVIGKQKIYYSAEYEIIKSKYLNFSSTLKEKGNPFLDNGMSKEELKELASQLGNPSGEMGIKIGEMMNFSNSSMIKETLNAILFKEGDAVLELGHGNAHHLKELHSLAKNIQYNGLDISELMKAEAEKYCIENDLIKNCTFKLYDGTHIPNEDNYFDSIFTVNTIYFWEQPVHLLLELYRVLKPKGKLCITFAEEESMNKMSFTEYGFTKYNQNSFTELVSNCNFKNCTFHSYSELLKSNFLGDVERKFTVAVLTK